jgi:hypothetical protein
MTTSQVEDETQSLAPPWLPRQQRQRINKVLNKLVAHEACSICGSAWKHNTRTAYGLDRNGRIVAVGECCLNEVVVAFGRGFFSERRYDFLNQPQRERGAPPPNPAPRRNSETSVPKFLSPEPAPGTKTAKPIERGGVEWHGVDVIGEIFSALDHSWKTDDRTWFEENPQRSHRARMPLAGEEFLFGTNSLPECTSFILVRQIKPGTRIRRGFYLNTVLLPVPDDEALIHAMFEIASGRGPAPRTMQEFCALREKYAARGSC